jgi:hypothetical protein
MSNINLFPFNCYPYQFACIVGFPLNYNILVHPTKAYLAYLHPIATDGCFFGNGTCAEVLGLVL